MGWRILLVVFGLILFSFGQWMAFEVYAFNKLNRINQNVASFIHGLYAGESSIGIPNHEENVFVMSTKEGKLLTSDNALTRPLNTENLASAEYSKGGTRVYVYTKRVEVSEYINTFIESPFAFGVSLSGLFLVIISLALILIKAKVSMEIPKKAPLQDEKLIKSLKALRSSLAMGELIPRESLEESKRLLEDIMQRMEGRQ